MTSERTSPRSSAFCIAACQSSSSTRTALGVAGITAYGLLWIGGGNDIIATHFKVSLNAVTYVLRVAVFVGPVIAFMITKRLMLSLQRADKERVLHGSESGILMRSAEGGYSEPHAPLSHDETWTLTQHRQYTPLENQGHVDHNGIPTGKGVSGLRARLSRWYSGDDIAKPTTAELHHHDDHDEKAIDEHAEERDKAIDVH